MKVWCVKWREPFAEKGQPAEGYCACKVNRCPPDGQDNVPTKCGMIVILQGGGVKRKPTCPECLEKLKERK
jgi:hypothetical protein